jgi:hypothetical protein
MVTPMPDQKISFEGAARARAVAEQRNALRIIVEP